MENPIDQKLTHKNIAKLTYLRQRNIIENLQENVYLDEVTGLPNNKSFTQMLNGLQNSWERHSEGPFSNTGTLIEFDLTGLKVVNDTYGKLEGGNHYLRNVAACLVEGSRLEDRVFRMGNTSDEFVLHLTNITDDESIKEILNRTNETLSHFQDDSQDKYPGIQFGLSATIAKYDNKFSPKDAYNLVDRKMTEAKHGNTPGERVGSVGVIFCN